MANQGEKKKRCNETLQCWLELNELLINVDNKLLINHCNKIYNAFGDELEIINFMIKHGNKEQLKRMQKCIKSIHTDFNNKKKQKKLNNPMDKKKKIETEQLESKEDIDTNDKKVNYFEIIPSPSIEIICGFLNKSDIYTNWKQISRRMAIIALKEMNKCSINVLNGNKLIGSNQNAINFRFRSMMTKYRETAQKRYYSLFDKEWMNIYQINEENQLLFQINKDNDLQQINKADIRYLPIIQYNPRRFILIDKRNTIILNGNGARIANENDTYNSLKEYKLYILQYFDIRYQTLKTIQFVMISHDITFINIINYIQSYFIHTNNDRKWYQELLSILHKMDQDRLEQKLCINQCVNRKEKKANTFPVSRDLLNSSIKNSNGIDNVVTFELNYNHKWCQQQKNLYFAKYTLESQNKLKEWYPNFHLFYLNYITFKVVYQHKYIELKSSISNYMNTLSDSIKNRYNFPEILEKIDQFKKDKGMIFYIPNGSKYGALQHEIANIIPFLEPQNIELMTNNFASSNESIKWNETASQNYVGRVSFDIIPYNNRLSIDRDQIIIEMTIKRYNEVPALREYINTKPDNIYRIKIKFNKQYKVIDLIKHLKKSIESISRIKANEYKLLLDILQSNNNNNYNFVLNYHYRACNRYYMINDKIEHKITSSNKQKVALYIYPRRLIIFERSILFKVRFAKRSQINSNKKIWSKGEYIYYGTFVGLPMIIWINKTDTLQYIIDTHLNKYKEYITGSYVVYPLRKEIGCVSERKRANYCLYQLISKHPKAFVTFAIKQAALDIK